MSKRAKGKVPAADWPTIAARHGGGESLAGIARDYGCTAPAIAYIVRRSKAREPKPALSSDMLPSSSTIVGHLPGSAMEQLDPHLRGRVSSDVANFLVAFEAASDKLTSDTRRSLLAATDRLIITGARTRVELERWTDSDD